MKVCMANSADNYFYKHLVRAWCFYGNFFNF